MSYPQTRFLSIKVNEQSLIGQRRSAARHTTLSYQLEVLKRTERYDAFKLEWKEIYHKIPSIWPIPDHLFWDSDIAKWIEGACYYLQEQDIPEVDAAVKELVEMIRAAQLEDGYLNLHYTMVEPGKRFTNLRDMHELYNAGHLIEAALAHNLLYNNDRLLEPILKYVDLLCETFGEDATQIHGYPGHPEIEFALLRLYDRTQDCRHLKLAKYFLTERGNPKGVDGRPYYVIEAEKRNEGPRHTPHFYPAPMSLWYQQAHKPIVEQLTIQGHAVRAMYLLTAVADLVSKQNSRDTESLKLAVYRLWENMTHRKMYMTGGIGAVEQWEGFGIDYFLPQGTDEGGCYAETCAAIGVMMLAERILNFDRDGKFADVMELCLFNAVLTAMSYDGKAFTYINQLASSDRNLSKREDWFTVACCPPNMLRILGQIGGYIWTYNLDQEQDRGHVDVHLFIPSILNFKVGDAEVEIQQESNWPWAGDIDFQVKSATKNLDLSLRIPDWSLGYTLHPACPSAVLDKGYLTLPAEYLSASPSFRLSIPIRSEWVQQNPLAGHNIVALRRGPIVYCVEDIDNEWVQDHFRGTFVNTDACLSEQMVKDSVTEEQYVRITLHDGTCTMDMGKFAPGPSVSAAQFTRQLKDCEQISALHFVPYYFRANRGGRGQMRVGLWKQS